MAGQQAYIFQKNNLLEGASVSGPVFPSSHRPLVVAKRKQGYGSLSVLGNYTGEQDAVFEVQIEKNTSSDAPVVSEPVFVGAGSGEITDLSASGLEPQRIVIQCTDTGRESGTAEVEILGYRFRAKQTGSQGNQITIEIDHRGLEFVETTFTLLNALQAGSNGLTGSEYDWDTQAINGALVPEDAHRIAFEDDPVNVYRQYKKQENGQWVYYFIPDIRVDYRAGSKIYFVNLGRTVTISDGATTETYTNIKTIGELWEQIRDKSSLIEPVDQTITTTLTEDSPYLLELNLTTKPYNMPPVEVPNGSGYNNNLDDIVVDDTAYTELIQVECRNTDIVGRERWNVRGSVGGEYGDFYTGDMIDLGHVKFRVPVKLPEMPGVADNDWSWEYSPKVSGNSPAFDVEVMLGSASRPAIFTLEYKKNPDYIDPNQGATGRPSGNLEETCLTDFTPSGGCGSTISQGGGEACMNCLFEDPEIWLNYRETQKSEDGEIIGMVLHSGCYILNLSTNTSYYLYTLFISLFARRIKNLIGVAPDDTVIDLNSRMQTLFNNMTTTLTTQTATGSSLSSALDAAKVQASQLGWSAIVYSRYQRTSSNTWTVYFNSVTIDWNEIRNLKRDIENTELAYAYCLKKNDSDDPSGCYRQLDNAEYYWEVNGGSYMPAFTGLPYYSAVRDATGQVVITKEFGLYIEEPSDGAFEEGDTITIQIGDGGGSSIARTYQVGDRIHLNVYGPQSIRLSGGSDGINQYTWRVQGEKDSFPDYAMDKDNPGLYTSDGLRFRILNGIIPFEVGDAFVFSIENTFFRWRKDGGAWSAQTPLSDEAITLSDGLSVLFTRGVEPSFENGDLFEIHALQENAPSNLITPDMTAWRGNGTLTISLAASGDVDTLVISDHNIQSNFTFQAATDSGFTNIVHNETISPTEIICKRYSPKFTARYFRFVFTDSDVQIGHIFLGTEMTLSLDADRVTPFREFFIDRTEGESPFSLTRYLNRGYNVEYASFILNDDFQKLDEMIQYLKENNDMPFFFVPNTTYTDEIMKVRVDADRIEIDSDIDYNAPKGSRAFRLTLPLRG